ncbi:hypothetical protein H072_6044 [Dactylellina haptotyla CBS 200.50]|uniref:DUF7580 domain-containing protein n=1 Tax=Dactylellina haptotyla (strain CBS 200.50) TaxID=1284197 RepID=S8BXT9_DACHA|nr:hypothetical protein H072_6044 [Dactylellina haptotyla CBS 200.50]
MSGLEIVGLLLGALALTEPIGKGLKSAVGITKSSASFQAYINSTSLEYRLLGQMFRNESRRIFGNFLTEGQLDDMFGDNGQEDPRWKDSGWKNDVKTYLGTFYSEISAAMLLVFQTLSGLNENIARLKDLDDLPAPGDGKCSIHTNCECLPDSIPTKIKSKLERRKDEIRTAFKDLFRYNMLYQSAVNRFLEDQTWKLKATKALLRKHKRCRVSKAPRTAPWAAVSQVIDDLHEATRRLSFALQRVATCTCHTFHLRLEMVSLVALSNPSGNYTPYINPKDPRLQTLQFNLITIGNNQVPQPSIGHGLHPSVYQKPNKLSLRIELKPYAQIKPSSVKLSSFVSPDTPTQTQESRSMTSCIKQSSLRATEENSESNTADTTIESSSGVALKSKLRKSVAFARNTISTTLFSTETRKRKGGSPIENPRLKNATINDSNESELIERSTVPEEIEDLCAWLIRLGVPSEQQIEEYTPGVLTADEGIQYLVFEERNVEVGFEMDLCSQKHESLLDHLTSGRNVLSIAQRLELAHTLAISLLRLHSSSWIERSWSSKDVMLFLLPEATDAQRQWSPYVAAAFNDITKIQQIAKADSSKKPECNLSYVASLGIIFLEIGLSKSLRDNQGEGGSGDVHIDAYRKAFGEVMVRSVNECMGPIYDTIVERCIKWMDSDELDDKEVQQRFYEEIVLGLERCIQTASAGPERRRRRRGVGS